MANMTNAKGGAGFPKPYVNDVNEDDPMMERVPMDTLDIGARKAGLPKGDVTSTIMGIEHVSNRSTGGK